jgi:hypothetical protein
MEVDLFAEESCKILYSIAAACSVPAKMAKCLLNRRTVVRGIYLSIVVWEI